MNKGAKYILWRFMQANRARLSVYPQCVFLSSYFYILRFGACVRERVEEFGG